MDDVTWYVSIRKTYLAFPEWGRVDMRVINLINPNRISYWTDVSVTVSKSSSDEAWLASDFQYLSSNYFTPARGIYHFSSYRYSRYDRCITNWTENVVEFLKAEKEMYKAEALANTGDVAGGANTINHEPRTTRGNL